MTSPIQAIAGVEVDRFLVGDIIHHARNIERLDNPIYRPLSEENYRSYVASQRFLIAVTAKQEAERAEDEKTRADARRYRSIKVLSDLDPPRLSLIEDYAGDCGLLASNEFDDAIDAFDMDRIVPSSAELATPTQGEKYV